MINANLLLLLIVAGAVYYLYTQGYFNKFLGKTEEAQTSKDPLNTIFDKFKQSISNMTARSEKMGSCGSCVSSQ